MTIKTLDGFSLSGKRLSETNYLTKIISVLNNEKVL